MRSFSFLGIFTDFNSLPTFTTKLEESRSIYKV